MDTERSPMPRWHSAPTGRTRTATFQIWTLDVWGHVPADCSPEYDCPCCRAVEDEGEPVEPSDGEPAAFDHDSDACQCDISVNDRSRQGTVDVEETETMHNLNPDGSPSEHTFRSWKCSDAALLAALGLALTSVVEWLDKDYCDVSDEQGRPLLQVERVEVEDEEESAE